MEKTENGLNKKLEQVEKNKDKKVQKKLEQTGTAWNKLKQPGTN